MKELAAEAEGIFQSQCDLLTTVMEGWNRPLKCDLPFCPSIRPFRTARQGHSQLAVCGGLFCA